MAITKYNVGDELWYISEDKKAEKSKVDRISLSGTSISYYLEFEEYHYNEGELFVTKSDLLNSL